MDFKDTNVIISGGSSGMGKATAKLLAKHGANVFILARDEQKLSQALEEIKAEGDEQNQRYGAYSADVASWDEVEATIAEIVEDGGPPDILINSAGIVHPGYFEELPLSILRKQMDVNYFGSVHTVRAVLPQMMPRKSGHIVNIASVAGAIGTFGYTGYAPSKSAVITYSEVLRIELRPHGIGVSVVIPKDTDTPQLREERSLQPLEAQISEGIVKPDQITRPSEFVAYWLLKLLNDSGEPIPPEAVATAILRGIRRGRYLIVPGRLVSVAYRFRSVLIPVLNWAFDQLVPLARRQRGVTETPQDEGPTLRPGALAAETPGSDGASPSQDSGTQS